MYDIALQYGGVAERRSRILKELGVRRGEFILGAIHRAENTDILERRGHSDRPGTSGPDDPGCSATAPTHGGGT